MRHLLREWQWQGRRRQLAQLQLLVLDVDGVLTDGGLWFNPDGQLQKRFDVRDGLGLKLLQKVGLHLAFLSGGRGGATEVRARQLGIEHWATLRSATCISLNAFGLSLMQGRLTPLPACS